MSPEVHGWSRALCNIIDSLCGSSSVLTSCEGSHPDGKSLWALCLSKALLPTGAHGWVLLGSEPTLGQLLPLGGCAACLEIRGLGASVGPEACVEWLPYQVCGRKTKDTIQTEEEAPKGVVQRQPWLEDSNIDPSGGN